MNVRFESYITVDEVEIKVDVEATYTKGSPARGPSYDSGGEPEEPASVELDSVSDGETEFVEKLSCHDRERLEQEAFDRVGE